MDIVAVGHIKITHPKSGNGMASLKLEILKDIAIMEVKAERMSYGGSL